MKIPFVDLQNQYFNIKNEIDEAIKSVISDSAFIGGKYVKLFEEQFSSLIGSRHCVSCANGTDALEIAIKSLNVSQNNEVITTAHSWISTSEAITNAGGKVTFVDTEKDTFNIDTKRIEEKINKNTVGIIPVHLFGQPCDMEEIIRIARKYNLWVIEDCAQSHLSEYKGKKVGNFGNLATFSFYPGKNIGAMGDAGCIITNDTKLADWCSKYALSGGKGQHFFEGVNSRMDGIQAAILSVKMKYIEGWTKERQKIALYYNFKLKRIKQISVPYLKDHRTHVYHLYVIKTDKRDELKTFLEHNGIKTNINYSKSLPFYPAYKYLNHTPSDFPVAYKNQDKILSLPIYPELSNIKIDYICEKINEFFG